jgi:hypothetical protein
VVARVVVGSCVTLFINAFYSFYAREKDNPRYITMTQLVSWRYSSKVLQAREDK